MKTKLIKIGNSQGVRIPKPVVEEIGLSGDIEMILEDDQIILRPVSSVRENWETAFREMAQKEDNHLLDQEEIESTPNEWDEAEWTW